MLVSDPLNDAPFVIGRDGDDYTRGRDGVPYLHALMMQGGDLSGQWTLVLQTYALVAAQRLPYSPTSHNSNSLAGTALRRIGVTETFSSAIAYAPGVFTELPFPRIVRQDRAKPETAPAGPTAARASVRARTASGQGRPGVHPAAYGVAVGARSAT